jgi:hypothetical protein
MERGKVNQPDYTEFLSVEAFKSTGYLIVNKTLIAALGLVPAAIIGNYVDKYFYFKEKNPDNGSWFYLTHDQQTDQLGIGKHTIIKWKQFFIDKGILQSRLRGAPPKEWLKINFTSLTAYIYKYKDCSTTPVLEGLTTPDLGGLITPVSGGIYKDYNYNLSFKETINKERGGDTKLKNVIPPTLEMVQQYCQERNNKVDPETFYDWNTSKGWIIGKQKMKDWQAAIRTWEKRDNFSTNYNSKKKTIQGPGGDKYTLDPDGYYYNKEGRRLID